MTSLRSAIESLASDFAKNILGILRGMSIDQIVGETKLGAHRRRATQEVPAAKGGTTRKRGAKGRLARRSAEDLASVSSNIVALLGEHPKGLRSEEMKEKLGLDARELARPLADALRSGAVSKRGQKRATTYFLGGRKAGSGGRKKRGKARAATGRVAKAGAKHALANGVAA